MSEINLPDLSTPELKALLQRIPEELAKREKEELEALRQEVRALAKARGYDIEDLLPKTPKEASAKRTVAPKYRSPEDHNLTWTGRGRKPIWVENFLKNGGSLDALKI